MDTATTPPKFITSYDVENAINARLQEVVRGIESAADDFLVSGNDPETLCEFMSEIGIPEDLLPSYTVTKDYSAEVSITLTVTVEVPSVEHGNNCNYHDVMDAIYELVNDNPRDYIDIPYGALIDCVSVEGCDYE